MISALDIAECRRVLERHGRSDWSIVSVYPIRAGTEQAFEVWDENKVCKVYFEMTTYPEPGWIDMRDNKTLSRIYNLRIGDAIPKQKTAAHALEAWLVYEPPPSQPASSVMDMMAKQVRRVLTRL